MAIFYIFNNFLKKLLPKTLLARFMIIIILPAFLVQILAIYLFYESHWYNVSEHTSTFIVTEIKSLLTEKRYINYPNIEKPYLNLKYRFLPKQNISKKSKDKIEELKIFKRTLTDDIPYKATLLLNDRGIIKLFLQIDQDLLEITLPKRSLLNSTTHIFIIWTLSLTFLLVSVSLIFSRNQIKSILELTKAADNYGSGGRIDNYKPSGAKEIKQAGLAFLKMKNRIEHQTAKRTQMLAMISHDLRTPLTRMKLQVALMNESDEKEELEYDLKSMQNMIESYLDFSRGEGGEEFMSVDLVEWLQSYLKSYWSNQNISLESRFDNDILVKIKPHSFARAITNIVDNAFKYASQVHVTIFSLDQNIVITIEDNGIGINDEEKQQALKPFYRGDKARSLKDSASVGLGLAIVKEIITGHYGSIALEDSEKLHGLLVRILLPFDKTKNI